MARSFREPGLIGWNSFHEVLEELQQQSETYHLSHVVVEVHLRKGSAGRGRMLRQLQRRGRRRGGFWPGRHLVGHLRGHPLGHFCRCVEGYLRGQVRDHPCGAVGGNGGVRLLVFRLVLRQEARLGWNGNRWVERWVVLRRGRGLMQRNRPIRQNGHRS